MLQSEFDRLTSRPYTEAEFSEIHYVYCYHPAVQSKKDIAELWTIGGICLIKDMLPTARRGEDAEPRAHGCGGPWSRRNRRRRRFLLFAGS